MTEPKLPARSASSQLTTTGPSGIRGVDPSLLARYKTANQIRDRVVVDIVLDGSYSRQATTKRAGEKQVGLLDAMNAVFPGCLMRLHAHVGETPRFLGEFTDGAMAAEAMRTVRCQEGYTNISGCLRTIAGFAEKPTIIVNISDCCEEKHDSESTLTQLGKQIGRPIFSLHELTEHMNSLPALPILRRVSLATGGACVSLSSNLDELIDLIKTAVALSRRDPASRQLVSQLTGTPAYRQLTAANPALTYQPDKP